MSTSAPNEWLTRMLLDQGYMDAAGLTRKARLRTCPGCRRSALAGLDSRVAGLSTWCDLTELSPLGEAMALVDGRWTYEVWDAGSRPELERRGIDRVRAHPPGSPGCHPVLAGHRCRDPIPASWAAPAAPPVQPQPVTLTDDLPF